MGRYSYETYFSLEGNLDEAMKKLKGNLENLEMVETVEISVIE